MQDFITKEQRIDTKDCKKIKAIKEDIKELLFMIGVFLFVFTVMCIANYQAYLSYKK